MEFGLEKCAMLIMKSGKRETTEGIELPSEERIRTLVEKKNDEYLRILKANTIKQAEMKARVKQEHLR